MNALAKYQTTSAKQMTTLFLNTLNWWQKTGVKVKSLKFQKFKVYQK